ncbi:MAG: NAD(P)-dependent oxidoreductase [Actinobacteria bacterium]|nr:NAD(P)-dependent oxidoreductase [Cyanobacteriota bacterium]MCL5771889.1 NAD(P)-dependent oxidoreductase [Actinomycetota bacterium]
MLDLRSKLIGLQNEGIKIKIGIVGVGQMGSGLLANLKEIPGMEVIAVATKDMNSTINFAKEVGYKEKKIIIFDTDGFSKDINLKENLLDLRKAKTIQEKMEIINKVDIKDKLIITNDASIIPALKEIDVVIDATGKPDIGAFISFNSIINRKHIVTLNVEGDVTIGPILRKLAISSDIVYTVSAGDEPAAIKELFDFASCANLKVVAAGKGKNNVLDRYSNPEILKDFAESKGSNPYMMTSFVDGTKTMIEMACLSNATGLVPDIRGMHGPKADIKDLVNVLIPKKDGGILSKTGVVDYVIGDLAPGVFLVYTTDSKIVRRDLKYLKNGDGPYFLIYRPYHLASIETPLSIAKAFLYNEPTIEPGFGFVSEVMTCAKKDLKPGDILDGIGGFNCYGLIELHEKVKKEKFLPIGISEGCIVKRKISKDEPIKYDDVEINTDSILFNLRKIQDIQIG